MSTSRTTVRLASLLLALPGLLLAGCATDEAGGGGATPTPTSTPTSTPSDTASGTPSQTPSAAPPRLISYAGGESLGYEVRTPEDVAGMKGAPASFKRFIARTVERMAARSTCEAPSAIYVERLRTDGFATGGVDDCGGYQALWAQVDGRWQEIDGTQEMEGCAVLEEYRVPSDLVDGRCYDYEAKKQRDYQQD
ncbi:hypothetical protein [Nocardioides hwasunensis]|uniref:Transglutaminase domain-containing protein n=1 Tax=Nocardioides hwasunensis TaxID=397258 RepID=A0ABR8MLG8_9ACTN|nr:hypothetical protein [Nocardioides hwasunensis]MBD3916869.1 hypothetical protein [Nocardioides hwasunensis]